MYICYLPVKDRYVYLGQHFYDLGDSFSPRGPTLTDIFITRDFDKKKQIQIYKAVNKGTFRGNDQSLYSL